MHRNIYKLLFKKVFGLWLVASLVVGGLVTYLEIEKIDDQVLGLALDKAYAIDPQLIARMPDQKPGDMVDFQRAMQRLTANDFVIAELYDLEHKHRAASIRPDSKKVEDRLEQKKHSFPIDKAMHFERFYIDKVLYIQILVPLKHLGQVVGYFEGVYRVDPQTIKAIQAQVYHTLLLVLVIILATFVMLYPMIIYLNRQLIRLTGDLFKANTELMEVMGSAIAKRDTTTDIHNYRVTLYALRLGEAINLSNKELCNLLAGAFLHDVGKIGIEDRILRKNGRLSEDEFVRMKEHVLIGIDIVAKADWLHGAREVIEFHHERFDGSGYMQGLSGERIPLLARLFAIVDVFDALMSARPYKKEMSLAEVLVVLKQERGHHFEPRLLDRFIELAPTLYAQYGQTSYAGLSRNLAEAVRKYFFQLRS